MKRRIVLVLAAVLLLCACASNKTASHKKTTKLTAEPTVEPTVEPSASPVPEKSGYFEIHTTKKVDAFGNLKREVTEIVALNKAVEITGSSWDDRTIYFLYDRGSRIGKNCFLVIMPIEKFGAFLVDTYVDDSGNDDRLEFPHACYSISKVQYLIDGQKYEVSSSPEFLCNNDFERIFAALMDGKDVDFAIHNDPNNDFVLTIHGAGFADLVSSVP